MSLGGCLSTNWMVLVHDGKLFKLFLSKKVTFVLSVLSDVYDLRTTLTDSEKLKPRLTGSCFMSQSNESASQDLSQIASSVFRFSFLKERFGG